MPESLKVGIMSFEEFQKKTLAVAKGKYRFPDGSPKVYFESLRAFAEVLSDDNRALLRLIHDKQPESISDLAKLSGRKQPSVSRTLKTMSRYGIVKLIKQKGSTKPVAQYLGFDLHVSA